MLHADGTAVRGLRAKSIELLAYLAMHPAGVAKRDILAAIWHDVPAERAEQRLSTCLANLRNVIRRIHDAAVPDTDLQIEPIVNTAGAYRLEPALVTADWWPASGDLARTEPTDVAHWRDSLDQALDGLDHHADYPWIDAVRQQAITSAPS